jgi:hypothetical protein
MAIFNSYVKLPEGNMLLGVQQSRLWAAIFVKQSKVMQIEQDDGAGTPHILAPGRSRKYLFIIG